MHSGSSGKQCGSASWVSSRLSHLLSCLLQLQTGVCFAWFCAMATVHRVRSTVLHVGRNLLARAPSRVFVHVAACFGRETGTCNCNALPAVAG